jgi:arsenite-transporting ATPase
VGKTTVAAATALAGARRGHRTLVMSLDVAHSLADAFDLGRDLFDQAGGRPTAVAPNLDAQEIDVQGEIARHWQDVYRFVAEMFTATGMDGVVAEELSIFPGTEDVIALMYLNRYVSDHAYDLIVLDAPPTGDTLRFVNIHATLQWYMRRRFRLDRGLARVAGPLLGKIADAAMPPEGYFAGIEEMSRRLEGVDQLLRDPDVTTVRLVTNPEKMVIRESQRAYLYFCLYGMATDQVIVNRVMPPSDGYFAEWVRTQSGYVDEIRAFFEPVPVATLPMFPREVVGLASLEELAEKLYGDEDPARVYLHAPPYQFAKRGRRYTLGMTLPFVDATSIDITRASDSLVIRIGGFKRHIPLPRGVQRLETVGARMVGARLTVELDEPAPTSTAERSGG